MLEIIVSITLLGKSGAETSWLNDIIWKKISVASFVLYFFCDHIQVTPSVKVCYPWGRFVDWNAHFWGDMLSEDQCVLIWIYHKACIEAYLHRDLRTTEKRSWNYCSAFAKEMKGSSQISSRCWADLFDFLAPNSDIILLGEVNMWWDLLEISWTLEMSVLLLKYLLCKQDPCPQLWGISVSSCGWLAESMCFFPLLLFL